MHEIVVIDSWKRTAGGPTDFKFKLNKPIRNIHRVELLHANLSNTFFTFNDSQYFKTAEDLGGGCNVQMPNKSFSIDELITFLNTAVNADPNATPGYTFSYDESTFKVTITHSTRTWFPQFYQNTIAKQLGFPELYFPLNAYTHTSVRSVSLEATDYIFVSIDKLSTICSNSRACGNFVIPITVPRGQVQQFNSESNFKQVIECNSLDWVDGQCIVIDDSGNLAKSDELNLKLVLRVDYC